MKKLFFFFCCGISVCTFATTPPLEGLKKDVSKTSTLVSSTTLKEAPNTIPEPIINLVSCTVTVYCSGGGYHTSSASAEDFATACGKAGNRGAIACFLGTNNNQ